MFKCVLKSDTSKENKSYTYLSIGVVIDDEIEEIDRHYFKGPSALSLIKVCQKREGKNFDYHCELKTETSKKGNEYTYLSLCVPCNGVFEELDKHFFSSDAPLKLIAISEEQYPVSE